MVLVYPPKSFLKLILIGFVFITLPLIIALVLAAIDVEKLADQSQHAIYQAVRITQYSRALVEQIPEMERSARQSMVLDDPTLFKGYAERHKKFQETARSLAQLPLGDPQKAQLSALMVRESRLFSGIQTHAFRNQGSESQVAGEFTALADLARTILLESSRLIDHEVDILQREATQARGLFLWAAVAFVPAAVIFAVVFAILISKPIRQIDQAIRRLGDGEFGVAVEVGGPQDLRYLGQRLDWLRERLVELEGEKNRFVRNVSHELKTPLTAIRESAELLNDEVVGELNGAQRDIIGILRDNSLSLQRLIESLLTFGLVHLRQPALSLRPVDLPRIIGQVANNHKPAMLAKAIRLVTELDTVQVQGDEDKLRTIVDNVVSNAVKYSPAEGVIHIGLTRSGDAAVLDVIDGGPGVEPGDWTRVFDAFYQGRAAHDGRIKGTGLGLAIARECVMAHGGAIHLVECPAGGAHFRVTIPICQKQDAA